MNLFGDTVVKAFEKWWNAEQTEEAFEIECGSREISPEERLTNLAKASWQAALKWFYSELKNNGLHTRDEIEETILEGLGNDSPTGD